MGNFRLKSLVIVFGLLEVGSADVVQSDFDLNGNGTNETYARSTVTSLGGIICSPCDLELDVWNGFVDATFDFDWKWGGLQFKSHVGTTKSRIHTWQTWKSVVEENGTINWQENPAVFTTIPDDQTFPAPAHLPVFSALLHGFGDLIGGVFGSPDNRLVFLSDLTPSGSGFLIRNSVTNNWVSPLTVDWSEAGVSGIVSAGSTLFGPTIFAPSVDESFTHISISGLADHGDGITFTHVGPSTFWVPVPEPSTVLLTLVGLFGLLFTRRTHLKK